MPPMLAAVVWFMAFATVVRSQPVAASAKPKPELEPICDGLVEAVLALGGPEPVLILDRRWP